MGDNEPAPVTVPDPGVTMGSANGTVVTPAKMAATCADLVVAGAAVPDGDYTLYIGGDASKPWQVYCADMASSPAEYLPLVMLLGNHNFSQYTAGGASPGTNVKTSYIRVRIDPATLKLDIGDERFAVSSGSLNHSFGDVVTSMPFGVAMSCGTDAGLANIDLTGTPFSIAQDFSAWGAGPNGGQTMAADRRVVDLSGGGFCGWVSTVDAPYNPYNDAHAWAIQLSYAP